MHDGSGVVTITLDTHVHEHICSTRWTSVVIWHLMVVHMDCGGTSCLVQHHIGAAGCEPTTRRTADNEAVFLTSALAEAEMRASMEALLARLLQAEQALLETDAASGIRCPEISITGGHSHGWWSAEVRRRAQGHARVVVPVYGIHGSANAKLVATLRWTAVEEAPITAESVKTQDSWISTTLGCTLLLHSVVQRKSPGDSEGSRQDRCHLRMCTALSHRTTATSSHTS